MEAAAKSEQHEDWKKRVYLGPLPSNFLRLESHTPQQQQEAADQQAALALHQLQMQVMPPAAIDPRMGRLSVTIVQAKLVKNYGMTRMDPFVRMRVGHAVYETHTDSKGGKNPHWNKVVQCLLPPGVMQIYLEIYDECSFSMDELVAWGHVDIPPQVLEKGDTHEDWYRLSGKQGDNQEGMINLVFSYSSKCHPHPSMNQPSVMMVPTQSAMFGAMPQYAPVNVYTAPVTLPPAAIPSSLPHAEAELQQISEMFPHMDKDVIKSVYDTNGGKKEITINSLLQMCE